MKFFNFMFIFIVVLLCFYFIELVELLYSEINFIMVLVVCFIYRLLFIFYFRFLFFKRLFSSFCFRYIVLMILFSIFNIDEWNNYKLLCNVFKNGLLILIVVVVWILRVGLWYFLMLEFVMFVIWNCLLVWDKIFI